MRTILTHFSFQVVVRTPYPRLSRQRASYEEFEGVLVVGFEFIFTQRHETAILPFELSRQPLSLSGTKTHPIVKRSKTHFDAKISSRGTLGYPSPV